jgi:capsular polysaccharide transport system ATP-binding protein
MIRFENVGKAYRNRKGVIKWIFRNIDASFPSGANVGILGLPESGKTTLINLVAGNDIPSEGTVHRGGEVSWPYGFRGTLANKLTCRQNLRFMTDVYGRNFKEALDFVTDFTEIGRYIDQPLRNCTPEMRNRLMVGTLFAMEFRTILVDGDFDSGDAYFRRKCAAYIEANSDRLSLFIATGNPATVSRYCNVAGSLDNGQLTMYGSVDDAVGVFTEMKLKSA